PHPGSKRCWANAPLRDTGVFDDLRVIASLQRLPRGSRFMATKPLQRELRRFRPCLVPAVASGPAEARFVLGESCSVLIGWRRQDAVLRTLSETHSVISGIVGLRTGDQVRLILYSRDAVVCDCRVTRSTLLGTELELLGGLSRAAA